MTSWLTLILVVSRLSGIVVAAPFFSRREIPVLTKAALVWAIALLVLPGVVEPSNISENFWLLVITELIYGLALGWGANFLFSAFQGAGHLMDQHAGFGMATWFDPTMGQVSVLSRFLSIMGVLLFLVLDGHYILLMAAMSGFEMVPPGLWSAGAGVAEALIHAFASSFLFVLRFGAPVMVVVFVTDIMMGLLGKTVPQLNVLMMGLPIKSMVSMLVLLGMMPAYLSLTEPLLNEVLLVLSGILESM